jgi:hypothetical protein
MLQRTYILINQSCHPVCWSFQFCIQEVPCCSQNMGPVRTSMLEQLVYTYIGGRIAGEFGIFDSQSPLAEDGPSIHPCSVGQESSAIDVAGCAPSYENGSSLKL